MDVKLTIKGSCGKEHADFKEWQECKLCDLIAASHNVGNRHNCSVFEKEVWNKAIEAAALRVEDTMLYKLAAYQIRSLKK